PTRLDPPLPALPLDHQAMLAGDLATVQFNQFAVPLLPALAQLNDATTQAIEVQRVVTDIRNEIAQARHRIQDATARLDQGENPQTIWPLADNAQRNLERARALIPQAQTPLDRVRPLVQPAWEAVNQARIYLANPATQRHGEDIRTNVVQARQIIDHALNNLPPENIFRANLQQQRNQLRRMEVFLAPELAHTHDQFLEQQADWLQVIHEATLPRMQRLLQGGIPGGHGDEAQGADELIQATEQALQQLRQRLQRLAPRPERPAGSDNGGSGDGPPPKQPRIDNGESSQNASASGATSERRIHGSTSEDPAGEFASQPSSQLTYWLNRKSELRRQIPAD
ncbi:hypothetical protein, partial [Burkholderia singularis]|uniref:hypothetical protein n=1 Tax=Burkholderia singularis TaxID=1503053 RepID=UPI001C468E26